MKTTHFSFLMGITLILGLAGCSKPNQGGGSHYTIAPAATAPAENAPKAGAVQPDDAPTTKELLAYYDAHLSEAKQKWAQCQAAGMAKMTTADRQACVAAQNAWYTQPYKPSK